METKSGLFHDRREETVLADFIKNVALKAAGMRVKKPVREPGVRRKTSLLGQAWSERKRPKHNNTVSFRANEKQRHLIEVAAHRASTSVSAFIRGALMRELKREMGKSVLPGGPDVYLNCDKLLINVSLRAKRGGPGYKEFGRYVAMNLAVLRPDEYWYYPNDDQWAARLSEFRELVQLSSSESAVLRSFTKTYPIIGMTVPKRSLAQFSEGRLCSIQK
jgi:hypothetical protein